MVEVGLIYEEWVPVRGRGGNENEVGLGSS